LEAVDSETLCRAGGELVGRVRGVDLYTVGGTIGESERTSAECHRRISGILEIESASSPGITHTAADNCRTNCDILYYIKVKVGAVEGDEREGLSFELAAELLDSRDETAVATCLYVCVVTRR